MSPLIQKGPGRPKGLTDRGRETKERLYHCAIGFIERDGYAASTIRKMARASNVSPALFYKYFPDKRSIILELHEQLSKEFESKLPDFKKGSWSKNIILAMELSLEVLRPHKKILTNLIPTLIGGSDGGVLSNTTSFARQRVEGGFYKAVENSKSNLDQEVIQSLARVFYFLHLGTLLFWLLDKSPNQLASKQLIKLLSSLIKPFSLSLRLRKARSLSNQLAKLLTMAFYNETDSREKIPL